MVVTIGENRKFFLLTGGRPVGVHTAEGFRVGNQAIDNSADLSGYLGRVDFINDDARTGRDRFPRLGGILFVKTRDFLRDADMILKRRANEESRTAIVGGKGRGGIGLRHVGDEGSHFHTIDRIRNHSKIGRAVGFRKTFNIVGDDFMFSGLRDDEELLSLFVNRHKTGVRNERFNRADQIGRGLSARVVVFENWIKFRDFFRIEKFEKFFDSVKTYSVGRAYEERFGNGVISCDCARIDGGDLRS